MFSFMWRTHSLDLLLKGIEGNRWFSFIATCSEQRSATFWSFFKNCSGLPVPFWKRSAPFCIQFLGILVRKSNVHGHIVILIIVVMDYLP